MKIPFFLLGALAAATAGRAQQYDNPVKIPVSYYGEALSSGSTPASFLFGSELDSPTYGSINLPYEFFYSPLATGFVIPGQTYTLTVTSSNVSYTTVLIQPINNCDIYLNGIKTTNLTIGGGNGTFTLRVETVNDLAQRLAGKRGGQCASFPEDKPIWYVGLGSLRTGQFAGAMGFRAASITPGLFNTSSLLYGTVDSSEVSVTRSGGNITQIIARDVVLNVTSLAAAEWKSAPGLGHVVFSAENIFNSSTDIELISGTINTYNGNNLLASAQDVARTVAVTNGTVAVSYAYTGGIQTSRTGIDGTVTTWALDNHLRTQTITTTSGHTAAYPTVTQSFTYFQSDLQETGQETAGSPTVTTYAYDTAGRPISVSQPKPGGGTLTTSYAYPSATQTVATLPTGATRQTDLYLDGKVADQLGTGQVPSYFDYTCNSTGQVVETTQHDSSQINGWTQDTFDWLNRKVIERTPEWGWTPTNTLPVLRKTYTFNSSGQLSSLATTDEGNGSANALPVHYYLYGNMGLLTEEGDDVNNNGALDPASADRITLYDLYFYKDTSSYDGWIQVKTVEVYNTLGNSSDLTTVAQTNTRFTRFNDGTLYGTARVLSDVVTLDASGRYAVDWVWSDSSAQTTTHLHQLDPATNSAFTTYQNGHLWTDQSISGVVKTYGYNASGQLSSVIESTTNAETSYNYFSGTDRYSSVVTSTGPSTTTTSTYAYSWNPATTSNTVAVTDAAGNTGYTEYNALGLVWHTWGAAAQPSLTNYDAYGRKTSLTTWQSGAFTGSSWPSPSGGNAVTWTLDPSTGATTTKTFPNGSHVGFTYNARGQMKTRTWARNVTTTYSYFDTLGSQTGELQEVSYSDGTPSVSFTYTRFGKILTAADAAGTRTLNYRSDLKVGSIYFPAFYNSDTLTENYDGEGRSTGYSYNGSSTISAAYSFDPATGRWSGNTGAASGYAGAFAFGYASGTDSVVGVAINSYSRSMPLVGRYDVISSATTAWGSTTLGSFTAAYTDSRGWRNAQTIGTSSYATALGLGSAVNTAFTYDDYGEVTASTNSGSSSLGLAWTYDLAANRLTETDSNPTGSTAYTPGVLNQYTAISGTLGESTLTYDADGNLTQDGTWTYTYDGENRIKTMTSLTQSLTFAYDYQGRRISKTVGSTTTKFLWRGWSLIAELQNNGNTPIRSYFWGPDFSDSTHGQAGGAGAT